MNTQEFYQWVERNFNKTVSPQEENRFIQIVNICGIEINLLDEMDYEKSKSTLEALTKTRDRVPFKCSRDYLANLMFAALCSEYLLSDLTSTLLPEVEEYSSKQHGLIISFYLSKYSGSALEKLGFKTFNSAFKELGNLIGIKASSMKNMRDEFDPYFDNGRKGWYQRELRPSRKEIYNLLIAIPFEDLTNYVTKIIDYYKSSSNSFPDSMRDRSKTRLKISSTEMKEISLPKRRKILKNPESKSWILFLFVIKLGHIDRGDAL